MNNVWAYDFETLKNFTLAVFYNGKEWREFDHTQFAQLREFVTKDMILASYNGHAFDDVILRSILKDEGITCAGVAAICKQIVDAKGHVPENIFKIQYSRTPWKHSIDLYQIGNKKGSLKELECRYHMPTVMEADVDFDLPVPESKWPMIRKYCRTDVEATWTLLKKNERLIELRYKLKELYDVGDRLFVLGDAGIAQAIFVNAYTQRTGGYSTTARTAADKHEDNRSRCWKLPEIISPRVRFTTPQFQAFHKTLCECSLVGDARGTSWTYSHPTITDIYRVPQELGGARYQLGVGGMHTDDGAGRFVATDEVGIYDWDVASYYPSLMVNEGIYPPQIGPQFVKDFTAVRDLRLKAKKAGDKTTADALKIVANSSFGKLNDPYSPIRSIKGALRVTINGQLQMLMFAEMCEIAGFRILSGNTDGLTIMAHRTDLPLMKSLVAQWEKITGHTFEMNEYKQYARANVNNYLAVKADGDVKRKGQYNPTPDIGKHDEKVVKRAAEGYLLAGVPIRTTVERCDDIRDFIYYQRVKNGGTVYHGDTFVGKIARWYVGKSGDQIRRKNPDGSFECLPDGAHAVLALTLPTRTPDDIDLDYYVHRACELVEAITNPNPPKKPRKKKEAA